MTAGKGIKTVKPGACVRAPSTVPKKTIIPNPSVKNNYGLSYVGIGKQRKQGQVLNVIPYKDMESEARDYVQGLGFYHQK